MRIKEGPNERNQYLNLMSDCLESCLDDIVCWRPVKILQAEIHQSVLPFVVFIIYNSYPRPPLSKGYAILLIIKKGKRAYAKRLMLKLMLVKI